MRFHRKRTSKLLDVSHRLEPKKCGDCEYAFEHLHGYDSYVCDIDAEPIHLNNERADCPRHVPMHEEA